MKIEKWVKNEINKRWNEASGLRYSKMMMKEPNTRRAKSLLNLSRNDLRVMMGGLNRTLLLIQTLEFNAKYAIYKLEMGKLHMGSFKLC
ncbi:CLUMA_CG017617, isoform A [Clunio marinus]|uniref:CLUMA_CG017617, isoform A n=1 Tax=Clunio marinus TaxID=568069 RepID=A0A1J1IWR7_9DIPT|nr:CLUMA_CG017617, isoform A [Clunio marinus]